MSDLCKFMYREEDNELRCVIGLKTCVAKRVTDDGITLYDGALVQGCADSYLSHRAGLNIASHHEESEYAEAHQELRDESERARHRVIGLTSSGLISLTDDNGEVIA